MTAPAPPPTGTWSGPGFPGDFDGDGDVDILVDAVNGAILQAPFGTHLLLNLGSGVYVDNGLAVAPPDTMAVLSSSIPNIAENAENCVVADLDVDGDLDIVVRSTLGLFTNSAGNSKVWINGGAGTFVAGADLVNLLVVAAGDMDQDGLVDLVAHQHRFRELHVPRDPEADAGGDVHPARRARRAPDRRQRHAQSPTGPRSRTSTATATSTSSRPAPTSRGCS